MILDWFGIIPITFDLLTANDAHFQSSFDVVLYLTDKMLFRFVAI